MISTQQTDKENNDSLERKHILQEKFNNMFDLLYGWGYKWSIFDMEKIFETLKRDCIYAGDFKTSMKCTKVLQDIGKRGQNARLTSRLTHYKIDIKTTDQAREDGINFR